jgi:hypothetical protein
MATGGMSLQERLRQLLPGVVTQPYEQLKYYDGTIVPTVPDLQPGAPEVLREQLKEVGDAAVVSDEAVDIPVVDISATEARYRTFMIASAFSYSLQQMRAIEAASNADAIGAARHARKMQTGMRSIAERDNKIAAYGGYGVTGFLNDASVTSDDNSTNLYTATADALSEFFIDKAATVASSTDGRFVAGDLVLSYDLYVLLAKKRMTDGNRSVMSYLLDPQVTGGVIRSITWSFEAGHAKLAANGAGVADKDRIVFYPFERMAADIDPDMEMFNQPEIVERHIEPTQIAPGDFWQTKDLNKVVPMFRCCTQTIINHPEAMLYVDVPKKA